MVEIVVPYRVVKEGDSLGAICWRLKDEYGDRRDWREIADGIVRNNNKKKLLCVHRRTAECAAAGTGEKMKSRLQNADGLGMYEVASHTSLF